MTLALVPDREWLDELISTNDAAALCGVGSSTIRQWAFKKYLKPWGGAETVPSGPPMYRRIDVLRVERDTRNRSTLGRRRTA